MVFAGRQLVLNFLEPLSEVPIAGLDAKGQESPIETQCVQRIGKSGRASVADYSNRGRLAAALAGDQLEVSMQQYRLHRDVMRASELPQGLAKALIDREQ